MRDARMDVGEKLVLAGGSASEQVPAAAKVAVGLDRNESSSSTVFRTMIRFFSDHSGLLFRVVMFLSGVTILVTGLSSMAEGEPDYRNHMNQPVPVVVALAIGVAATLGAVVPWPRRWLEEEKPGRRSGRRRKKK